MIPKSKKTEVIPVHGFDNKAIPFDIARLNEMTMKNFEGARQPHRHSYYEVFIFFKGGGKHYIDFNSFEIEDYSMHFISPGQVHLIRRAMGCSGVVITFPEDLFVTDADKHILKQIAPYNSHSKHPIVNCTPQEMAHIKQQVKCLISEYEKPGFMSLELVKMHLNIILISGNRWFLDKIDSNHELKLSSSANVIVQQFKSLVDLHYLDMSEVSEYAELMSVTSGYLNDAIKKSTGFTASWHIHNRILLEAKRLLYHSSHSVKEISFMLNFDDPTYFGRFFKKQIGQTPGEFRASIREKYHK